MFKVYKLHIFAMILRFIVLLMTAGVCKLLASPVLGVVMLHADQTFPVGTSYTFRSGATWLEQVDIRWIPLYLDEDEATTKAKLEKLNGIFLTGGFEPFYDAYSQKR